MNKLFNIISSKKISIIITIIVISILYLAEHPKEGTRRTATTQAQKYYTCIGIKAGDSLWNIADEYMTDEYVSKQEYIDEVVSINKLDDESSITAGCNLVVPYYKVSEFN